MSRGCSFVAAHGLLIAVASLAVEQALGTQSSVVAARELSGGQRA